MKTKHQILIVYVLLVAYTLPILVTVGYYITHPTISIDFLHGYFAWIGALARDSTSQLNLFHKILLPVIAGISAMSLSNTALAADTKGQTKGVVARDARVELILYCIAIIVLALIVTVAIDVNFDDTNTKAQAAEQSFKNFIASISEFVGVYLMLLLGLKSQS